MQLSTDKFDKIPVGIIQSILDTIALVGEVAQTRYQDISWNAYPVYSLEELSKQDDVYNVSMVVTYYIDESMVHSFSAFLHKFVEDQVKKYNQLDKCWSLEYDKCD